eukprot:403356820
MRKLFKIGITGGIGSGKTKLLQYLSSIPRVYTINLDLIGHEIYKYNPHVLRNIRKIFGDECVQLDNSLQHNQCHVQAIRRDKLGEKVFKNEYNLNVLKSIMSPEIKRFLIEQMSEMEYRHGDKYDVIAVEGAILIEMNTHVLMDEVWVTTLDKEDAVQRVMKRNPNLTEALVRDRINRQIDDKERLKYASFHYDTSDKATFEQNKLLIDQQLQRLRDMKLLQSI